QACLGGDQNLVTTSLERRAQNLLRCAVRIHIGRVEQSSAGIETNIDQSARVFDAARAPCGEQRPQPAERAGAEAQDRDLQAGFSKVAIFHDLAPIPPIPPDTRLARPSAGRAAGSRARGQDQTEVMAAAASGRAAKPAP